MNRRDAFTLTELLVLVPLIALVGTLLLASLGDSKQTVQAAACLNNMRQWGLAAGLYSNDWNDFIPNIGGGTVPIDQQYNVNAWFNVLPRYINQTPLKDLYTQNHIPLPGMRSVFVCPSIPPDALGAFGQVSMDHPFFAYNMNRLMTGVTAAVGVANEGALYKRSVAVFPAQVILFSPSEGVNGGVVWYYPYTDGYYLGKITPRHSGGDNFVFVDGHAEWVPLSAYKRNTVMGQTASREWVNAPLPVYWYPCKTCDKNNTPRW